MMMLPRVRDDPSSLMIRMPNRALPGLCPRSLLKKYTCCTTNISKTRVVADGVPKKPVNTCNKPTKNPVTRPSTRNAKIRSWGAARFSFAWCLDRSGGLPMTCSKLWSWVRISASCLSNLPTSVSSAWSTSTSNRSSRRAWRSNFQRVLDYIGNKTIKLKGQLDYRLA